jgi:hypothetical protein
MVSLSGNRFYSGVVYSPDNPKHPNFRFIVVDTIYDVQDDEGNWYTDSFEYYEDYLNFRSTNRDVFYGVYGSYWIDIPKSSIKITETDNLKEAIHIAQEIMGNEIVETTPKPFKLR